MENGLINVIQDSPESDNGSITTEIVKEMEKNKEVYIFSPSASTVSIAPSIKSISPTQL